MAPWHRATAKAIKKCLKPKAKTKPKPVAKEKTKLKPVAKAKKSKPVAKGSRSPGVSGVDTIPTTDDNLTDLDRLSAPTADNLTDLDRSSAPGVPGYPTTDDSHPDPDAQEVIEAWARLRRGMRAVLHEDPDIASAAVAIADAALKEFVRLWARFSE